MNVNHPLLGVIGHNIEVEYSPVIFTQSPVFDAYEGTTQRVGFDVDNDETPTFEVHLLPLKVVLNSPLSNQGPRVNKCSV